MEQAAIAGFGIVIALLTFVTAQQGLLTRRDDIREVERERDEWREKYYRCLQGKENGS